MKAHWRRKEPLNNAEREQAEERAALRWNKEVLGILLEAGSDLPFHKSLQRARSRVDGASVLRCCRGLRPNTLKQRVSDWRPFRRWLLAEGSAPFPSDPSSPWTSWTCPEKGARRAPFTKASWPP